MVYYLAVARTFDIFTFFVGVAGLWVLLFHNVILNHVYSQILTFTANPLLATNVHLLVQVGSGFRMGSADLICADKCGVFPTNRIMGTKPQVQTCTAQLWQPVLWVTLQRWDLLGLLFVCVCTTETPRIILAKPFIFLPLLKSHICLYLLHQSLPTPRQ